MIWRSRLLDAPLVPQQFHRHPKEDRKCAVRIGTPQQSPTDEFPGLPIGRNKHRRSLRGIDESLVLGIRKKSNGAGTAFLDLGQATDLGIGIPFYLSLSQLFEFPNL